MIEKIDHLNCPTWQKLELLQAVIDTTKGTYAHDICKELFWGSVLILLVETGSLW